MAVSRYRRAIEWLAANDDNDWLSAERPRPSMTAALVIDLWGVSEQRFRRDLIEQLRHIYPRTWDRPLPWEGEAATTLSDIIGRPWPTKGGF